MPKGNLTMNREDMRKRAKDIEAEIVAKTADVEADIITKAEYREYVDKAFAERVELKDTLDAYQKAVGMSAAAEPNPGGLPAPVEAAPRELQDGVPMTRKEFSI